MEHVQRLSMYPSLQKAEESILDYFHEHPAPATMEQLVNATGATQRNIERALALIASYDGYEVLRSSKWNPPMTYMVKYIPEKDPWLTKFKY